MLSSSSSHGKRLRASARHLTHQIGVCASAVRQDAVTQESPTSPQADACPVLAIFSLGRQPLRALLMGAEARRIFHCSECDRQRWEEPHEQRRGCRRRVGGCLHVQRSSGVVSHSVFRASNLFCTSPRSGRFSLLACSVSSLPIILSLTLWRRKTSRRRS